VAANVCHSLTSLDGPLSNYIFSFHFEIQDGHHYRL